MISVSSITPGALRIEIDPAVLEWDQVLKGVQLVRNQTVGSALTKTTGVRLDRQAKRDITHARSYGQMVSARESAKVEAVAQVTEAALLATSHVSAVEALLVSRTPHAEARLRHIADAGCAGMASIVFQTGSQI